MIERFYLSQFQPGNNRRKLCSRLVITSVPHQVHNISALSSTRSGLTTGHSVETFDLQMAIKTAPRIKRTQLRSTLEADLHSAMDANDGVNKSWSK